MKQPLKLFIVRKYIYADNAQAAILKDKKHKVDDVWWDEDNKKNLTNPQNAIGFQINKDE